MEGGGGGRPDCLEVALNPSLDIDAQRRPASLGAGAQVRCTCSQGPVPPESPASSIGDFLREQYVPLLLGSAPSGAEAAFDTHSWRWQGWRGWGRSEEGWSSEEQSRRWARRRLVWSREGDWVRSGALRGRKDSVRSGRRSRALWNRYMRAVHGNTTRLRLLTDESDDDCCQPIHPPATRRTRTNVIVDDDFEGLHLRSDAGDELISWNVGMSGLLFVDRGSWSDGANAPLHYLESLLHTRSPTFVCLGEVRGTLREMRWLCDWLASMGYDANPLPGPGGVKDGRQEEGQAAVQGPGRRGGHGDYEGWSRPHGGVVLAHRKGRCERQGACEVLCCSEGVAVLGGRYVMGDGRTQGVAACYASPYA